MNNTNTYKLGDKIVNNLQLAEAAILVATQYKTLYVMGCFGAPMNDKNKKRYCDNNKYNRNPARQKMIKEASPDTFGFDCVCLIKSLLWGWYGDKNKTYGGAVYKSNGVPDIGADAMIKECKDVSTDMKNIMIGEAVWSSGHIGIYVGNGLAVECTPKWENKVQITACNTNVPGYNRRNWTKHGKLPYIEYISAPKSEATTPSVIFEPKSRYTTTAKLNIRTRAGVTHKSIGSIPKGAVVECDNSFIMVGNVPWLRVRYNGVIGYSSGGYLKVVQSSLQKGSEFVLTKKVKGYMTAGNAKNAKYPKATYKPALYSVYSIYKNGSVNITKSAKVPGAWVML